MSIRNKLTGAVLSLALITTFGFATYAQQTTTTENKAAQPKTRGMRRGGRQHRTPVLRIMRDLKLTEAQHEQARAIIQRFKSSIEPQRQALKELRKQREQGAVSEDVKERAMALRGQIRESFKGTQTELLGVLTPDQRSQYDQLEQQWKTRREERRARRAERRKLREVQAQPPAQ